MIILTTLEITMRHMMHLAQWLAHRKYLINISLSSVPHPPPLSPFVSPLLPPPPDGGIKRKKLFTPYKTKRGKGASFQSAEIEQLNECSLKVRGCSKESNLVSSFLISKTSLFFVVA